MLVPRPYQEESIEACEEHLATKSSNPCVVLPTGAGKSLVMALMLHRWSAASEGFRALVLAHRKELVGQNAEELEGLDPSLWVGVFSASLKRRDTMQNIIFASIDSIANNMEQFAPFDVLLVDEAHRIPAQGEGKYRRVIEKLKTANPNIRVVGLTATPYRMGVGDICHRDHILNEVCYEANVGDLIGAGYLSKLRTVKVESNADLKGIKKSGGDFNLKDLALRVDRSDVVSKAVNHLVRACAEYDRKSVIVFCIDVEHCKHVSKELSKYGINAPWIIGATPNAERDRLVEEFKEGKIKWMLSVDCFFEGFNAKRVDCVAMLRPTQSKGLWVQAVGRGLRLFPGKEYCLILDYGENIMRHGPIDLPDGKELRLCTCEECENEFSRAVKKCPSCGWVIPPQVRLQFEQAEERERKLHDAEAGDGMLVNEPKWMHLDGAALKLHRKAGRPSSVRVEYFCGKTTVKAWITLEHDSYAGRKARKWLSDRGFEASTAEEFLSKYTGVDIYNSTEAILVRYEGKYLQVVDEKLRGEDEDFEPPSRVEQTKPSGNLSSLFS